MKTFPACFAFVLTMTAIGLVGCSDIKMPDVSLPGSEEKADATAEAASEAPPERTPVLPPLPTVTPEQMVAEILERKGSQITDADLAKLADMKAGREVIQALDLTSATVSSKAFQSMLSFPELKKLDFQATRLSDGHWLPLSKVDTLEWLNLTRTGINDTVLPHLTALKNLRHLDLSETFVSDEGFAALESLSALQEICVDNSDVNGEFLGFLGSRGAKAKLTKIRVGRSNFGYQGFVFLKEFPSLIELHANGTSATDASMEGLKRMEKLEVLELEGNLITDLGLPKIVLCSNLRVLSLADNVGVSDRGVQRLSRLKKLERLNLNGTNCSVAAAQKLKASLPDCVILAKQQEF